MIKQIGFIGDIHGYLGPLEQVVREARSQVDHLVFLGDYVDRGPKSRDVIDYLINLRNVRGMRTDFVAGDHETTFLGVLNGGPIAKLLCIGGASTVSSYVPNPRLDVSRQLRQAVPAAHVDFLSQLKPYVSGDTFFAAHDRKSSAVAGMNARGLFGVYGHAPRIGLVPEVGAHEAMIDTGCGTLNDGRLTCFLWPSRDWFQVSVRS